LLLNGKSIKKGRDRIKVKNKAKIKGDNGGFLKKRGLCGVVLSKMIIVCNGI